MLKKFWDPLSFYRVEKQRISGEFLIPQINIAGLLLNGILKSSQTGAGMYYLGVDGGGTKTLAILADKAGDVIRFTRKGPGNLSVRDRESLAGFFKTILEEVLAGEEISRIRGAVFAFAGAGRAAEKRILTEILKGLGLRHFTLMTDAEIFHYSVFGDEPGILIAAGTGSVGLVRTGEGGYHQLGGWGYLLGDEGSGFDIGRQAIRTALSDFQLKKEISSFTRALLEFYGVDNPANLISVIYASNHPSSQVASCAKLVCELAEQNDRQALRIIDSAAEALLNLALQAVQVLGGDRNEKYKVSLTGGILTGFTQLREKFQEKARQQRLAFEYLLPELEPAAAGVLYALKQSDPPVSENLIKKLKNLDIKQTGPKIK